MSDDPTKPKARTAKEAESTSPPNTPVSGFDPPPVTDPEPGTAIQNPAQPYARTIVPEPGSADSFLRDRVPSLPGFPKTKWHPVHGGVEVKDPTEEATLGTDWFNTPEEADKARTATEAWIAQAHNTRAKIQELDEQGHPIVRNSVQADQSIRDGKAEPL